MKFRVGDRVTVEVRTVGFGEPRIDVCAGVILRLADDSGQYGVEIAQPRGRPYWVFKRAHEMTANGPSAADSAWSSCNGQWRRVVPGMTREAFQ